MTTITWDSIPDFPLGEAPEDLDWNLYRLVVIKRAIKASYEDNPLEEIIPSLLADLRWLCKELNLPWYTLNDEANVLFIHQVFEATK